MINKVLTISVAAYNAQKWISKCLSSFIIPEIMDKIEVIIVNDGSKDNTEDIAQKYVKEYPNTFKLINKENGGHGSTINTGIKEANGEYFKIVDADDWVDKNGLIKLVNMLEKGNVDLVINPYYKVNENGNIIDLIKCFNNKNLEVNKKYDFYRVSNQIILQMHSMTFKTSLLKKMKYKIDENCFYVDVEYILYPLINVNSILFMDDVVYYYLIGTQEQSMNFDNLIKRREQHKKVCFSLIRFYKEIESLNSEIQLLIRNRINEMICFQYYIYSKCIKDKKDIFEIKEFDEQLRNNSVELYNSSVKQGIAKGYKHIMLIKLFRNINFFMYHSVCNIVNIIK